MNTSKVIFDAIKNSITNEGIYKMFLLCIDNNSIENVISTITDNDDVVDIDEDFLLELIKKQHENSELKIIGYYHNEHPKIDYFSGIIRTKVTEKHARYYNEDHSDYHYSQDEKFNNLEWVDDYNFRHIDISVYKDALKSRPVEE